MVSIIIRNVSEDEFLVAFIDDRRFYRVGFQKINSKWEVFAGDEDLANNQEKLVTLIKKLLDKEEIASLKDEYHINFTDLVFKSTNILKREEYGGISFLF